MVDCTVVRCSTGERRFKLDFPWDGAKTLSLRANNLAMKKAWMDVLKAALKELVLQIEGTGSVFALGGKPPSLLYMRDGSLHCSRPLVSWVVIYPSYFSRDGA